MKIRIKSFNGELPNYLSECKEYFVYQNHEILMIYCDEGIETYIDVDMCRHLNGGSWEILDKTTDNVADIKYHVSPNMRVIG